MGIVALYLSVQAAEIYNKDGNKLDVYGKVKAMHYMSDNADSKDGDQSYIRFGFKGETPQIPFDQLTGYGRWKLSLPVLIKRRVIRQKRVLAFAGLKYKDLGSFDYGRNWARCMTWKTGPICSRNLVATLAQTDNFMTKRASGLATNGTPTSSWRYRWPELNPAISRKNENRDVKKQKRRWLRHVIDI